MLDLPPDGRAEISGRVACVAGAVNSHRKFGVEKDGLVLLVARCLHHDCIGNFNNEPGSIVRCSDGTFSHAGGIQGACSHHGVVE